MNEDGRADKDSPLGCDRLANLSLLELNSTQLNSDRLDSTQLGRHSQNLFSLPDSPSINGSTNSLVIVVVVVVIFAQAQPNGE